MNERRDPRQHLPSVDKILLATDAIEELKAIPHQQKVDAIRIILATIRADKTEFIVPSIDDILQRVKDSIESKNRAGIRRVVNATGIIFHTNLGRAVLPVEAMAAVSDLDGYCNLQINLEDGTRGRRDAVVEELLRTITGAESSVVVNNNAAATLLVLAALCRDKEVIVSRGQLIEIGGAFRLPDVIAQSGARMVEVGTTNKTHLRDYAGAINEETGVILRVNPSNYRITGFTKSVPIKDLVPLKEKHDVIVVDDLGCGALFDLSKYGLPYEPTVQDSIKAGADVALFSGDKLISGPQSGIIIGKKKFIDIIRKHPLMRALRVDKFTIAALEATLKLFLNSDALLEKHPALRMITMPYPQLKEQAEALQKRLQSLMPCEIKDGDSACGGGSLPGYPLKTALVVLHPEGLSETEFARRLRLAEIPIITRVHKDSVCIDVRTLQPGDENYIESMIKKVLDKEEGVL